MKTLFIILGSILLITFLFFWTIFKLIGMFNNDVICKHKNYIELSRNIDEKTVTLKCKDCNEIFYKDIY